MASVMFPGDLLPRGECPVRARHSSRRGAARDIARIQDNKQCRDRGNHGDELVGLIRHLYSSRGGKSPEKVRRGGIGPA